MKPYNVRFPDSRISRFAGWEYGRLPVYVSSRKRAAKLCAKEWRAVREDRRFALPILAAALRKNGFDSSVIADRFIDPLHHANWRTHEAIPSGCYKFAAAHVSETNSAKIACYPTRADAIRGREIVMSPGRVFAACMPDKTASEIQALAETFAQSQKPVEISFATTPDEWAHVYSNARGFSSCMSSNSRWDSENPEHPVRFYAHDDNDLALSYLSTNGQTVARAIVNTEAMKYVRVYGDARLELALELAGYSHDPVGALRNQKCNARTDCNGNLIAPYLDAIQRIDWDGHSNTCTISANGDYEADQTDGTANGGNLMTCDNCGDRTDEDGIQYSDHHDMHICDDCANRDFMWAIVNDSGRYTITSLIRDDECVSVGGKDYLNDSSVLAHHGIIEDTDGEWQLLDDCVYLESEDGYVLCDHCTELDIEHNGDSYARDRDTKTIVLDGEEKTVHVDYDGEEDATKDARASAMRIRARKLAARAKRKVKRGRK